MNLDQAELQPASSRRRRTLILVFAVAMTAALVYSFWPAAPLNDMERRLVGTWRFQDPGAAGGKSYAYVFHNDRTISGGVIQEAIPQSEWQGKWSIEGTNLSIKRHGIVVLVSLAYQCLGCQAPDRPIPVVWNSEDVITLDRGGKHPDVLIRMREQ